MVEPKSTNRCAWLVMHKLGVGTVDSLLGKLRSIFDNAGCGTKMHSLLGIGNQAACRSVRNYLSSTGKRNRL